MSEAEIALVHSLKRHAFLVSADAMPTTAAIMRQAAAEITRLRNHAAGLALEREGFQEECKRLRADLAAAQERERVLREALARVAALRHDHDFSEASAMLADEIARAALGEPQ